MDSDVPAPGAAPALPSSLRILLLRQLSLLPDIPSSRLSDISVLIPESWQPALKKLRGAPATDPVLRNIITIVLGALGAILIIYIYPYPEVRKSAAPPGK
ncbi:hypothetical protein JHW43_003743 [Diplocarpon mali]|nr:hypothetical protein JHW43_003743 [Diplocarpon mali]